MQQFSVVNLLADYKFPSRKTHFMFGTGIKTVEGGGSLYRNDSSLLYALTCVYVYNFLEACSSRNHVSHSWRSNASIGFSCGKPSIYVLRSSVLSICQQPGVFSLPLPSCLAPSLSCSSSQLSVSFFFFIRSFVQAFSLSFFFFYDPSSPVSPFYLIIYLFSIYFHLTVHIFVYVSCPSFPSPILLFSSAFHLYPSFAPRRLSSTLSFFGSKNEEQRLQFCLSTSLKNFFRINFRYLFFFLLLFMLFILLCTSSIFFSNHLLFSFFFFAFHFIFLSVSLSFYTLFSRFYSIVKFFNFSFLLSLKSLIPFT